MHERKIYPKFKAIAKNGRLFIEEQGNFASYLMTLENKELEVVVKQIHKSRSRQEEKFYYGVVVKMVAEALSITEQEAHDLLKSLFLEAVESKLVNTATGTQTARYKRILSITELTDVAFREYWKKCIDWAALPTDPNGLGPSSGLGLYIPNPNEVDFENW